MSNVTDKRKPLGELIHTMLIQYRPFDPADYGDDAAEFYMQSSEYMEAYEALNQAFPDLDGETLS